MRLLNYKNATEAFEALYDEIMIYGHTTNVGTKALYDVCFTIDNPMDRVITTPWRKFNKKYAELECAWYLSQDRSPEIIGEAARIWKQMGKTLNSNYGYQVNRNQQFAKVVNLLAESKDTRRAIVTIYDGKEIDEYPEDTPCCLNFGFNIVGDKLNMTIHFRSQDLFFGFGNDQYTLEMYHKLAHQILSYKRYPDLEIGHTTWMVNDLHVYERHWGANKK